MEKSEWDELNNLEQDVLSDRREPHQFGDKTKWPIDEQVETILSQAEVEIQKLNKARLVARDSLSRKMDF
ncbi:hypothetical protein A3I27_01555 [Candidatus Giovannonibacteria bacterium RIFCSPLOWO2_02_FULL_43_11b]|uniref:Uncharacterized protein n=1 Tax=Candidatus Giovannonibacteria bacterium RIFCSPHIGHO2_12_FULL_43_15 TaxID=1798341 RepID=A0A1F5WNZ2_9BACT|nr:MAG: hypothetical protein A2739_01030 [Candidatus Giovannonibacteria bacterium RIFCSPHIGHO2_01_FULL_43_100]OGF66444.1 MAG: hypothetical protein A3B97_03830 [Candidatus Giovannonibacteria bacterium RIFCSPHIGHO2_02_FULL_43_32]OGF77389.1 MAG: hypothetical protein A3F23_03615 [Candidatus Giovannonibacteria bacterium RIFCSPHIGHO2_12_FULL_43_15]OGF78415.1 MAG: hypothetical protein A3A15_03405 [Candidatus Giovannonibacteria bacterium RIFCSPLOWO2_01_FULL_43_60]OGF89774.1 MAG: hypothetical protein A3